MHRSSMRAATARLPVATFAMTVSLLVSTSALAAPLGLAEALSRAAGNDPAAPAADARVQAAQAAVRQAGVRANPSLAVDVENFAGTGPYQMLDSVEATVAYEQTWER